MSHLFCRFPFVCAPMEGVMQPEVVRACGELALVEIWLTPFFRVSQDIPKTGQLRKFLAPYGPETHPVVLQLMGTDPERTAAAARLALELGIAGIDLNLGCPSRQVTHHGAGAGALRRGSLPRTLAVAAALREAVPAGCFSIKMRMGWSDPAEFSGLLAELAHAAAPDCVTVHCRTAQELYRPLTDRMERFAKIADAARACGVPFLLNGDIAGAGEARRLMTATGAAGVMIGRGFWRDPWILRRLAAPDAAAPSPETGRLRLWRAILRQMAEPGSLSSRGKAVELAHLMLGRDADVARELRALPDAEFPTWLGRTAE